MMDFDDLDEVAAAAVEAGDEEARLAMGVVEPPEPWNGHSMRPMKRSIKVPSREHLPAKVQNTLNERTVDLHSMRLFVMYGGGDSFVMWSPTLNVLPDTLDVAIHEYPGHGIRDEEPHPKDQNELSNDVWDAFKPILSEHAKGGKHEGAPFALLGHSQGVLQMVDVAEKMRVELGIRPCAVFALDRPPPGPMGLSQYGYDLLTQPWMDEFYCSNGQDALGKMLRDQKEQPRVQKIGYMWQNDMRISNEAFTQRPVGFHTFKCDVYVFLAEANWMGDAYFEKAFAEGTVGPEQKAKWEKQCKIQGSKPDSTSYFDRAAYVLWEKWTLGKTHYHNINCAHNDLKADPSAWKIMLNVLNQHIDSEKARIAAERKGS